MNKINIDIIEEKRREEMRINSIGNDGILVRSKMTAAWLFHTKRERK